MIDIHIFKFIYSIINIYNNPLYRKWKSGLTQLECVLFLGMDLYG